VSVLTESAIFFIKKINFFLGFYQKLGQLAGGFN
jgi:hypothetical protein